MLAGVARIIEICFVAKHFSSPENSDDDGNSDHTLADAATRMPYSSTGESGSTAAKAFRHLPPFVCHFIEQYSIRLTYFSRSCLSLLGKIKLPVAICRN